MNEVFGKMLQTTVQTCWQLAICENGPYIPKKEDTSSVSFSTYFFNERMETGNLAAVREVDQRTDVRPLLFVRQNCNNDK